MKFFAGIDGGQSSTVAVVGDERGRIIGRGEAGPADEVGAGKSSTRLRDALRDALADACRAAHLDEQMRFDTVVAGVSGYDGRVYGRPPELPASNAVLVHDTPIAHAGALGGRAGVVVIAGTGSVVYGNNDAGWSCTLGGWGFLFGDEGSAFAIARDALAMLMRAHDEGAGSLAAETRVACKFFEVTSLRRLAHAFYKMEVGRDRLATFAPEVMRLETLREPAERGADRLAQLVATAIAAGAAPRVAFVGGVFSDARFRQRLGEGILRAIPQAEIVDTRYRPAEGALLLAYRQRGLDVTELEQ